ncbi:MAG: phenylalanine--tRNA ligase subunit alpha [Clostridia bacterium]|nr:phenylalanine--tRNA ligase subunit alpha [Clostridia bacterium]MCI8979574.1 phenylalanine--tRNA ligase subunit alpha [Clostridia bacterium]MCI9086414.1 phenylalanine--tRNA ligase subunit alpha [Clostridia bacterium]
MKEKLEQIKTSALDVLKSAADIDALEEARIRFLGKKGELTAVLKGMGQLSAEERPKIGALANEIRSSIENHIDTKKAELAAKLEEAKLKAEVIDVTMPGKVQHTGELHPLTKVMNNIKNTFIGMGFEIAEGPDVELDYYNFEALNIPPNHPARDTQDTFYINDNTVLRTQTSGIQIRVMEKTKPPIRIIAPGKVYRSDALDATHSPVFHQIEGLVVDKGVTMADLKGTIETFLKELYGESTKVRFRPHHFPFTEPSAEADISCFSCGGKGCSMCKGEGWIEILGCGMVHPKVLANCGIDPEVYSGFAFGMGLERVAMGKYDINDIRLFFENDLRFLGQF